jgi:hypothetical protein
MLKRSTSNVKKEEEKKVEKQEESVSPEKKRQYGQSKARVRFEDTTDSKQEDSKQVE